MGCAGCGVRIPPAGSFGAGSGGGPGIPPAGSIGTVLGAGAISTDTRLGGNGSAMGVSANMLDWHKHPIALVLILVLVFLFVREVVK